MSAGMDDLIEQWLEGSLATKNQGELLAWLKEDPQRMKRFVAANMQEQMLRDAVSGAAVADEVQKVSMRPSEPTQRLRRWSFAIAVSVLACLIIAVGWFASVEHGGEKITNVPASPFVTVAAVQDTVEGLTVGDRIGSETIVIDSGLLRLLFDDGVEVTLQGPAKYELIALGRTRLHAGLLTATVPPGAEGFRVQTPAAEVIDLGTAFGIELNNMGLARVSVFDGEVEVTPNENLKTTLVKEGEAVQVTSNETLETSAFDTVPFEKVWPVASGIAGSTGAFRFAPPWPRRMGLVQSNSEIFVLPEGYAQTLDRPLTVNAVAPGEYRVAADLASSELPVESRVKSYLLQFKPINAGDGKQGPPSNHPDASKLTRITGDITFDRPVLGLILKGDDLRASDGQFSVRGGQVPQKGRALELFGTPHDDVIALSEDRRTVSLDLAAFGLFSDQVRVIVDQSLPK